MEGRREGMSASTQSLSCWKMERAGPLQLLGWAPGQVPLVLASFSLWVLACKMEAPKGPAT